MHPFINAIIHLKCAFKNHYNNKERFDMPTYKTKHDKKQSYTTSVTNNNSRIIDNKHIRLPKVGIIRAKVHRNMPNDYKLKSVTVSREADGKYYASLLYEYEFVSDNQTDKELTYMIGIDYSMNHFGVLSDGSFIDYPKYLINDMDKVKELERKLSKCDKKSHNYQKRKNDLARLFIKIRNKRNDFLNKSALTLAKKYDYVSIETLDLQDMSKSNHYGKAIYDNSYYSFTSKLEKKLESFGKKLVRINKYFPSSKRCSHCGNVIDRDVNAAINIACEGFMTLYRWDINI